MQMYSVQYLPFFMYSPKLFILFVTQTLFVDKNICLCDCPGLVFPSFVTTKAEMVVSGILPIDQMRDHIAPVSLISFFTVDI